MIDNDCDDVDSFVSDSNIHDVNASNNDKVRDDIVENGIDAVDDNDDSNDNGDTVVIADNEILMISDCTVSGQCSVSFGSTSYQFLVRVRSFFKVILLLVRTDLKTGIVSHPCKIQLMKFNLTRVNSV